MIPDLSKVRKATVDINFSSNCKYNKLAIFPENYDNLFENHMRKCFRQIANFVFV